MAVISRMARTLVVAPEDMMGFMLNLDYLVVTSVYANTILHYNPRYIKGRELSHFLIRDSQEEWELLAPHLARHDEHYSTFDLTFRTKKTYAIPTFCYVAPFTEQFIILIAVRTLLEERQKEEELLERIEALRKYIADLPSNKIPYKMSPEETRLVQLTEEAIYDLHYQSPDFEKMATKTGLSLRKFKELFVDVYGISAHLFFQKETVRKSKALLRDTELPIHAIAKSVHYSVSAFTRLFKRETSMSPKEFRNKE